jgi:acyl-CoA thioesterase-2
MWVRVKHPIPDDRRLRACALTYLSDLGSGFGQLDVDDLPSGGTSIDHAVWFHSDIDVAGWMLLELHPSKASGSRGVYTGGLRDAQGALGLMCAQELLLRPHPPEHLAAMRALIERRQQDD